MGTPNFETLDIIKIGDKVRSYDFANHCRSNLRLYRDQDAGTEQLLGCFFEGIVTEIGVRIQGCDRYKISTTKRVWNGKERIPEDDTFFPPMNGTPQMFDDEPTNAVHLI